MRRTPAGWLAMFALAAIVAVGCGPSQEEQMAETRQAEMDVLREAKAALDAKRQELADALAEMNAAGESSDEATGEEEGEAAITPEDLAAKVEDLEDEVLEAEDNFTAMLVDFINSDPPVVGEPMSEAQAEAIRMKSAEDIILAQGYIDQGGDYQRAIRIYTDAIQVDPDNADLKAALAAAEENRFVNQDRFAAVKKGMTRDEVREMLGPVNLRNIRDYKDRDVIAWFYPTAADGAAAAVYFRKAGGEYKTYEMKYEAVEGKEDVAATEGEGE